ncbi:hypothetical protein LTR78_009967 [Recurvomyces mirabilis]|uniref:DNA ligase D 3'-phosphoesterase domain-containing protein n=1 Tax=Recurvomyces mirabilis TaxID=574656 RepID=A0AAE0WI91_9PEZI|nr:hypothetical protein LTR78_009967 [Recurvomyces mirabilis]KAK5160308.1 hypothetical protein LTS14_001320 [Recurvomyces mirabilis]
MVEPKSLARDISPPPTSRKSSTNGMEKVMNTDSTSLEVEDSQAAEPTLAAIEAGQAAVRDHLEYFAKHLSAAMRKPPPGPRLSIADYKALYRSNEHPHGRHFVVHQHDHPISGVHYDLRLQFSESSTISFAIPYGLPGNSNSQRPNRMAIETRVHNLWNNLIESASHATGSLLIWDTGEYGVLDRPIQAHKGRTTDDELSDDDEQAPDVCPQSERLFTAFQSRHIHLRLHGTRLPRGYTIALRLPRNEAAGKQPKKPSTKRRRIDPTKAAELAKRRTPANETDSDSDPPSEPIVDITADDDAAIASEGEEQNHNEVEEAQIRINNAYPGAKNSIGSIHQRHWLLTLDRRNSGFHKARSGPEAGRWAGGFEPFFVMGRDEERSVVTGRKADDVMSDEGVNAFVGRKMWRPIVE